jgi:hypothetical protein
MLSREETILRREIMTAFAAETDVLVMVNEVNAVHKMSLHVPDRATRAKAVLPEERFGLGKGSPDLIFVVCGLFLGIEVKRAATDEHRAGELSPEQREWRDKAARAGVIYRRVRSVEEARAAVAEVRTMARLRFYRAACAECHDTGVDASTGEMGGCSCRKGRRA